LAAKRGKGGKSLELRRPRSIDTGSFEKFAF